MAGVTMEKVPAASARIQHLYGFLAFAGGALCLTAVQGIYHSRHERHTARQRAVDEHEDRCVVVELTN